MSYDIIKGWPSQGALDQVFAADSAAVTEGMCAALKATGNIDVATYPADGSLNGETPLFVFGVNNLDGRFVAANHGMIIELVNEAGSPALFAAGAYAPNVEITATAGVFGVAGGTSLVVAKVISYDAAAQKLVIQWLGV